MNQEQKDTIREEYMKRGSWIELSESHNETVNYWLNKLDQAYQLGAKNKVEEVENILKKELSTWAKESIGAKAVESVQRAISDKSLKDNI